MLILSSVFCLSNISPSPLLFDTLPSLLSCAKMVQPFRSFSLISVAIVLCAVVQAAVASTLADEHSATAAFSHAMRRRRALVARQDLIPRATPDEIERAFEILKRSEFWSPDLQKRAALTSGKSGRNKWSVNDDDQNICFCVNRNVAASQAASSDASSQASSGASSSSHASAGSNAVSHAASASGSTASSSSSSGSSSSSNSSGGSYNPTYVYNNMYDSSKSSSVTNNNQNTTFVDQSTHDSHNTYNTNNTSTTNNVHEDNHNYNSSNSYTDNSNNYQDNSHNYQDNSNTINDSHNIDDSQHSFTNNTTNNSNESGDGGDSKTSNTKNTGIDASGAKATICILAACK